MQRTLILAFAALVCAATSLAADPPPPNLENPTDYIAWANAEYGKGIRDNAADLYRQAAEAFVMHQETEDALKDKQRSQWTDEDKQAIRAWADANAESIRLFEQAAGKGDCFFELPPSEDGAVYTVLMPYLGGVRNTAKLIARKSYLDLLDGKSESALSSGIRLIQAANHFQSQPLLISYLVGLSMRAIAYDTLIQIPAHAPDADFAAILTRLRAHDPVMRSPERQFAFEAIAYQDTAQRCLKDTDGDGKLDQFTCRELLEMMEKPNIPAFRPMTFDEVLAEGADCYKRLRAAVGGPPKKLREVDQQIQGELRARGPSLAAVLLPSLARAGELYHRGVVHRSGLRIVLAAHAFKKTNGRWPRDLKEATADESPGVRKDPFSGKELVYRSDGGSILLYSVGEDCNDDGGKRASSGKPWTPDEPCDAVLWPLKD